MTSDTRFFVHLRVEGRVNVDASRLPFWSLQRPHPTAATADTRTEMGSLVARDESDAPLLSDIGIDMSIRSD